MSDAGAGVPQTVLLVEDLDGLREAVADSLASAGFRVLVAADGEAALEIIRTFDGSIDWLLTDLKLPGPVDGWHVAFAYRYHHPLRPVIYATGHPEMERRPVEGSVLLVKPYTTSDVIAALARIGAAPAP